jgi:hypothetical protein
MSPHGLAPHLRAAVLFGVGFLLVAMPLVGGEPSEVEGKKLRELLAVQKALSEGRDQIKRGNFKAAVFALESEIARINANPDYLKALAEAYRGYVRELQQADRIEEMNIYLERLQILDKGVVLDASLAKAKSEAPAPAPLPLAAQAAMQNPVQTSRGKSDESTSGDPFAKENRVPSAKAKALLEQAEKEFKTAEAEQKEESRGKHFAAASRLFEQAHQADEHITDDCGERWGYCKLFVVGEAINHPSSDAPSAKELGQEVKKALALVQGNKKLQEFGNNLLRRLEQGRESSGAERPTPTVEVKHTPRQQGQKWAMVETTYFRVLHNQEPEFAEQVVRAAEAARVSAARKWFNDDGVTWTPRCDIILYPSREDYLRETQAPIDSPGHAAIRSEGERIVARHVHLRIDEKGMLTHVLPHEVTHVVLAGRFDGNPVPRWADEGMAVLSEPRERVERHLTNLAGQRSDGQLFTARELLTLDRWPAQARIGAFYAQSVSLVDYLCRMKSPQVFTQFMREAMTSGYEPSLQKHFGIRDLQELDQRWQQHAFGNGATTPTVSGKPR